METRLGMRLLVAAGVSCRPASRAAAADPCRTGIPTELTKPQYLLIYLPATPQNHRSPPG